MIRRIRTTLKGYWPVIVSILALSWPVMLENAMQTVVQYVDMAMVGVLGARASAAVGLTGSVTWMTNGPFFAAGVGVLAVISRALGAKDIKTARSAAGQSVWIALTLGLVVGVITLVISPDLPRWLNADAEIHADSSMYFSIICLPMLFRACNIVFGAVLRAAGDTRTPMFANLAMNFFNIVLNFLLIYATREIQLLGWRFTMPGAGLGVCGAAIATALAHVLSGILMTIAMKRNPMITPTRTSIKINGSVLKRCLAIAVPVALSRLMTSGGHVVFSGLVAGLGTISLATHAIALTAEEAFYVPAFGLNAAAATLTGNALGERDMRKLDQVGKGTIALTLIMMSVTGGLLFVFARQIMSLFSPDAQVISAGVTILRIVAVTEPMFGLAIAIEGMLQGAGDTKVPFWITTGTMWQIRIVGTIAVIHVFHLGLTAVWCCMVLENTVRGMLLLIRYLKGKWKQTALNRDMNALMTE